MKIKIKDEMDDIRLKVSHQELLMICDALDVLAYSDMDKEQFNHKAFDKDEVESEDELFDIRNKLLKKIRKTLSKINPW